MPPPQGRLSGFRPPSDAGEFPIFAVVALAANSLAADADSIQVSTASRFRRCVPAGSRGTGAGNQKPAMYYIPRAIAAGEFGIAFTDFLATGLDTSSRLEGTPVWLNRASPLDGGFIIGGLSPGQTNGDTQTQTVGRVAFQDAVDGAIHFKPTGHWDNAPLQVDRFWVGDSTGGVHARELTVAEVQTLLGIGAGGGLIEGAGATLVIAAGVITPTHRFHLVDTEGAAASDDLDTIDGTNALPGNPLVLQQVDSARDVTAKNGTGNLTNESSGDLNLVNTTRMLICHFTGSQWGVERYTG